MCLERINQNLERLVGDDNVKTKLLIATFFAALCLPVCYAEDIMGLQSGLNPSTGLFVPLGQAQPNMSILCVAGAPPPCPGVRPVLPVENWADPLPNTQWVTDVVDEGAPKMAATASLGTSTYVFRPSGFSLYVLGGPPDPAYSYTFFLIRWFADDTVADVRLRIPTGGTNPDVILSLKFAAEAIIAGSKLFPDSFFVPGSFDEEGGARIRLDRLYNYFRPFVQGLAGARPITVEVDVVNSPGAFFNPTGLDLSAETIHVSSFFDIP